MAAPAASNFFESIIAISSSLSGSLSDISTKLTVPPGSILVGEVIMLMVVIEIMLCFIMALNGSGQKAISQGIEVMLYASFIYSLTLSGGWTTIVKPMVDAIPKEVITAFYPSLDPTSLPSMIAIEFSTLIRGIMLTIFQS